MVEEIELTKSRRNKKALWEAIPKGFIWISMYYGIEFRMAASASATTASSDPPLSPIIYS
jgi:hypothetical protein